MLMLPGLATPPIGLAGVIVLMGMGLVCIVIALYFVVYGKS